MKIIKNIVIISVVILVTAVFANAQTNAYNIIPKPVKLEPKQGQFVFNSKTQIVVPGKNEDIQNAVLALTERLLLSSGMNLEVTDNSLGKIKPGKNMVFCKLTPSISNKEGYRLKIKKERIEIEAGSAAGIFYAMQTVRQLMPPEIERNAVTNNVVWAVPCAVIEDEPRYPYRGTHIDVARHFSNATEIKRQIDNMAFHKINRFHWHLTDNEGWRIEIKQYPQLTAVGAWRNWIWDMATAKNINYPNYGGFYTQEELKDVVAYAKKKFITIIPEIEIPGHSGAAIRSYSWLACAGKGNTGVYCSKATSFEFLEKVIAEMLEIFPGEYIHIGGDEVNKDYWESCDDCKAVMTSENLHNGDGLQSYFIKRIETFVNSKGRKIIGWEEIMHGGLAPNATVMQWLGGNSGYEAAKQGHDVVMAVKDYCYFNYVQSTLPTEPSAHCCDEVNEIYGGVFMPHVYSFDPTPEELTTAEAKHILGVQNCLWSERIPTMAHMEYLLFPRLAALSEVAWTPKKEKNYEDYLLRLTGIMKHYDAMNINYSRSHLTLPTLSTATESN